MNNHRDQVSFMKINKTQTISFKNCSFFTTEGDLLNWEKHITCVPACFTCLRVVCLRAWCVCMLACLRAYLLGVLACLHVSVVGVLTCYRACVLVRLARSRAWCSFMFACFACLRACCDEMFYFFTCLRAWRA